MRVSRIITMTTHERHGVSNHRQLDCLFSHLFSLTTKELPSSALLDPCEGNHRLPMDFPHKGPVLLKVFLYLDVIMGSDHLVIRLGPCPVHFHSVIGPMRTVRGVQECTIDTLEILISHRC